MFVSMGLLTALLWALPAAPPCEHRTVEVRVPTRAGHLLAAWITVPTHARALTAVLIGGAGESDRYYSTADRNRAYPVLADSLACAGIGTVRFDEVGVGASTGSYAAYATTRTLANDVQDLVTWLAQAEVTRRDRLVLVGHSEGGAIAALVASETPRVAGIVLLAAPVLRGEAIIANQSAARIRDGETEQSIADREQRRLARGPWHAYFLAYDPAPAYARLTQPVLVLQGGRDWQVTPMHADSIATLLRQSGNRRSMCVRFASLPHAFASDTARAGVDPRVLMTIRSWLLAMPAPLAGAAPDGACVEQ